MKFEHSRGLKATLGVAGLLSFGLAASFRTCSSGDERDIVQPVVRKRQAIVSEAKQFPAELVRTAGDSALEIRSNPTPMQAQVTKNPFGELNLQASVHATGASSNESSKVKAAAFKPRTPKKQPPPPVVQALPPPPPPPSPQAPAPPSAPTLPFTVMGGIKGQDIADGRPVAFLRVRDEVLAVRAGDEVDKTYRVEAINTEKIEFTYLPLMQRQVLPMKP